MLVYPLKISVRDFQLMARNIYVERIRVHEEKNCAWKQVIVRVGA